MINGYDIIPLVAGITTSVVLAMVLFTVAWIHRDDKTRYSMLLRMFGFATLLDSCIMSFVLHAQLNAIDCHFIKYFIQPAIVSAETGLGAFAIFSFFRGSSHYLHYLLFSCYGFMGIVLLYPVMYGIELNSDRKFWDISNYLDFALSAEGKFMSAMIFVTAFTFNFLTTKNIFQGHLRYNEIIEKYYSFDLMHIRHICLTWWGLCLFYTVLAYTNIMVDAPAMHHVLRYFMILTFLAMVLILISHEDMLKRIDSAFRSIKIHNIELLSDAEDKSCTTSEITQDIIDVRTIMEHWAKRSDKPFNEIGITLKSVSDDMRLPMSVLLKYVHICYGMGFRSWILALRDESEKELQT